jgi:hypothetical protein
MVSRAMPQVRDEELDWTIVALLTTAVLAVVLFAFEAVHFFFY